MEPFSEAENNWDLETLYAALASINGGRELTKWQKDSLKGLLCGYSPKAISTEIYWCASSLRTELSRRLYPLIAALIDKEVINWSSVVHLLEKAGYKNPPLNHIKPYLLNLDLQKISRPHAEIPVVRASAIIASIEKCLPYSRNSTSRVTPKSSSVEIKSRLDHLIEQGDDQSRRGNFNNAIKFYQEVLLIEPSYMGIIIKIAMCFDRLKLYKDSWSICDFVLSRVEKNDVLSRVEKNEHRCEIYNFLGGVFHELALYTHCESYTKTGVAFYREAHYYLPSDLKPI